MDLILFLYGLAFLLLGTIVLAIKGEEESPLEWPLFAAFALLHGLNEWLDLVAFSFYDGPFFGAARTALMAVSFLFLIEFGRRSLALNENRTIPAWGPAALLALGCLGLLHSPTAANCAFRYTLGFTGALLAARAIWLAASAGDLKRKPLYGMAAAMGFYAVATGLIVPDCGFPPARWINYSSFTAFFGFPVQLLRGLLACVMAVSAWACYLGCGTKQPGGSRKAVIGRMLAISLFLAAAAGWLLTTISDKLATQQLVRESEDSERLLVNRLQDSLAPARHAVVAMAGSPWLAPALAGEQGSLNRANSVLDRYCASHELDICYLINTKGLTIASSNRAQPKSLVGSNYTFRPYFREAAAGKFSHYFARGVTTGERGYYAAAPVMAGGRIAGVVAVKKNIDFIADELRSQEHVYFVSPEGIVFISSDKSLRFHTLWPLTPAPLQLPALYAQFGKPVFTPLLKTEPLDDEHLRLNGKNHYVSRAALLNTRWSIVMLTPTRHVEIARFTAILLTLALCLLLLTFFLFLMHSENERATAEMLLELKEDVKTLSGIVPICAGCKKIRDDTGYWNRVETYISAHTEAKFSHGLCPDCEKRLYPEYAGKEDGEKKK